MIIDDASNRPAAGRARPDRETRWGHSSVGKVRQARNAYICDISKVIMFLFNQFKESWLEL